MAVQNLVSVDIGGTFTDCLLAMDGKLSRGKADTTPYNIGVGFMKAIKEAASTLDMSLTDVAKNLDSVRYSTTVAMNSLIQRTGPKIGVIVTKGTEDVLRVGRVRQWADGLGFDEIRNLSQISNPAPIVPRDLVVGIGERIDCYGQVVMPLDRDEIEEGLRSLMEKGVRGIAVCLLWSFLNPEHERTIRDIIREIYPENFLGNLPVMLSSDIAPVKGEYARLNTTVLNTYIQVEIKDQIHTIGSDLRDQGYKRSIYIVHNTGGLGKFTRTPAVNIYGSGPVSGLYGVSHLCKLYGIKNAIGTDMGGTSFDYGVIAGGDVRFYSTYPVIDRFRVSMPLVEMSTIGAGGGSIAYLHSDLGRLMVGPKSAGAMPGPVCYNMGGMEPTVTDADLVLGYLAPNYFLGGKKRLNKAMAEKAIKEKIADPMGVSVAEAAWAIKEVIDAKMADMIFAETALKGIDPTEVTLFAYGGAGPTHCVGYGDRIDVSKIVVMPTSSVFCALGSAMMRGQHVYEYSGNITLQKYMQPVLLEDYNTFNKPVKDLMERATNDMRMEGYKEEDIQFRLELDMKWGGTQVHTTTVYSPRLYVSSQEDIKSVIDAFQEQYAEVYGSSAVFREAGAEILTFRLRAIAPPGELAIPVFDFVGKDASSALKGQRTAFWGEETSFVETDIYEYELLQCGNEITGPAIIETKDTTVVLPPEHRLSVDKYLHCIIEKI